MDHIVNLNVKTIPTEMFNNNCVTLFRRVSKLHLIPHVTFIMRKFVSKLHNTFIPISDGHFQVCTENLDWQTTNSSNTAEANIWKSVSDPSPWGRRAERRTPRTARARGCRLHGVIQTGPCRGAGPRARRRCCTCSGNR